MSKQGRLVAQCFFIERISLDNEKSLDAVDTLVGIKLEPVLKGATEQHEQKEKNEKPQVQHYALVWGCVRGYQTSINHFTCQVFETLCLFNSIIQTG